MSSLAERNSNMRYRIVDIENKAEENNYNLHFDGQIVKYVLRSKITHACYTFDKMKDVIQFMTCATYRYHGYNNREDYITYAGKAS
jgi:hypothetical protein